jgi:cysteine desulfurase
MRIYLDHNATTPLCDEVAEAMARAQRELHGNPSSAHAEGGRARAELERARERVAALVGARPAEVVFTSGATEANNLALQGLARAGGARGGHLVASAIEHPSVEEPLRALADEGWSVTWVAVDRDGRVDPDAFAAALRADTRLATLIWAHNETGVVQPVEAVAERCRERGVPLHVDATQAVGKLPVRVDRVDVDLLSASAHKFNGPKGCGFLVVRGERALWPWLRGGGQERGRRGGTPNVPGAVGLGAAAERAGSGLEARAEALRELRERLWSGIEAKVPAVRRTGPPDRTLPNTLHVEFRGAPADVLLEALDGEGVAVSAGAACASGALHPSQSLVAMGRSPEEAASSLRLSLGLGNDAAQVDRVLALLPDLVERVRRARRDGGAGAR